MHPNRGIARGEAIAFPAASLAGCNKTFDQALGLADDSLLAQSSAPDASQTPVESQD